MSKWEYEIFVSGLGDDTKKTFTRSDATTLVTVRNLKITWIKTSFWIRYKKYCSREVVDIDATKSCSIQDATTLVPD